MANTLDARLVLKHLTNGTLGSHLCIICLKALEDTYENIFTKICKEDKEYCIADVLENVCQIKFAETENYNVCVDCFLNASSAYKFYLQSKQTEFILQYYTDAISTNLDNINWVDTSNSLCLTLPEVYANTGFDFDLDGIGKHLDPDTSEDSVTNSVGTNIKEENDNIVMIIDENGEAMFFNVHNDTLVPIRGKEKKSYNKAFLNKVPPVENNVKKKKRRNRKPMTFKSCSQCPVKYRFIAKLKEHMKEKHNIVLYVCKICKAITENESEFQIHLRTHTNIHQCALCDTVFKKRDTIIAHIEWHEKMKQISESDGGHVCEMCGLIYENEKELTEHCNNQHCNKYTCYYCGKMYKGEISFEMHIQKHEKHLYEDNKKNTEKPVVKSEVQKKEMNKKRKCICATCGKNFVDERALMWHQRLHNNERPYVCKICGRGFVSLNRCNQHSLCAHTVPTRRCPLCPALFHLRSMVNTHIKKVHLTTHKRRNRTSKYNNVCWRTEPVPIQELSISVQNEILELKAKEQEPSYPNNINYFNVNLV